jgi:hypothetical protein
MAEQGVLIPTINRKRAMPRVMAHMIDCGAEAARFQCKRCGWDSDWLVRHFSDTEIRRGVPCERCNCACSDIQAAHGHHFGCPVLHAKESQ